jgi:hypothetical protein
MKWEEGREVAKAIDDFVETDTNLAMNEHNCNMHNSMVACNNVHAFKVALMDSKKKLLNVLTRY